MNLSEACILLLVLLNVGNVAAAAAASYDVQLDVTALKDELRQAACRLSSLRDYDQWQTFAESVYEKHGQQPSCKFPEDLRSLVNRLLFAAVSIWGLYGSISRLLVWCPSSCSKQEMESGNITWCVNIANLDRVVEMCISRGADGQTVTNSTCEAELVGVPSSMSLPSVSN